jgi:hypothetical protein
MNHSKIFNEIINCGSFNEILDLGISSISIIELIKKFIKSFPDHIEDPIVLFDNDHEIYFEWKVNNHGKICVWLATYINRYSYAYTNEAGTTLICDEIFNDFISDELIDLILKSK